MSYPVGTILDAGGHPVVSTESFPSDYEGSTTGARLGDWGLSSSGPSASAFRNLVILRKRARDSERNNPNVKGGLDSQVANLVGTSISPSWNIDNQEQKEEVQQVWEDSQIEADFYGVSDFYGTQDMVARSVSRDGEVLGRFHDVDPAMGLVVPLQVQLLEADHLDVNYNDISPEGNEIRFGIEWRNGRRYRYWPYTDHPGESFLTSSGLTKIPVDASDMMHIFRPLRAGQARGVSWLAPILLKLQVGDQVRGQVGF